jgi:hypothetical protein
VAALLLPRVIATGGGAPAGRVSFSAGESRGRQIIERAIAAHGGRQAWLLKKDAVYDTTWTHYRSGRPVTSSRYIVKFPIASGQVTAIVESEENGKPVLMGASGSRSWFLVGQERREDLESLKANRAFVRRAQGLLALPFRLDDPSYSLAFDGEQIRAGALVDRVKAQNGLEPPSLYLFDRETGRLVGMGSEVADPPTAIVSDYYDFEEMDGILIPRTQVFDRVDPVSGGRSRALTVSVDRVRFDNGLPPATFEPPAVP